MITLILAGLGLFLGLSGPATPLLSIVPAAVGAVVLVLFLPLPRYVDRLVRPFRPGRLRTFLTETAPSVRDTERLVFHPDRRILGAIGYLWFDIAVLFACFAAAGQRRRFRRSSWPTRWVTYRTSSPYPAGSACSTAA